MRDRRLVRQLPRPLVTFHPRHVIGDQRQHVSYEPSECSAIPIAKYAIDRAGNDRRRCSVRPHSAITASTTSAGKTFISRPELVPVSGRAVTRPVPEGCSLEFPRVPSVFLFVLIRPELHGTQPNRPIEHTSPAFHGHVCALPAHLPALGNAHSNLRKGRRMAARGSVRNSGGHRAVPRPPGWGHRGPRTRLRLGRARPSGVGGRGALRTGVTSPAFEVPAHPARDELPYRLVRERDPLLDAGGRHLLQITSLPVRSSPRGDRFTGDSARDGFDLLHR